MADEQLPEPAGRNIGPWVIAGMFLFAIAVTVGLYSYWNLHTQPYRSLTDALGREFPGSNPRVEGGKHGLHRDTPRVLRIVMRVPFDPHADEDQFREETGDIFTLSQEHVDFTEYDECEIHLFQLLPEQEASLRSRVIEVNAPQE